MVDLNYFIEDGCKEFGQSLSEEEWNLARQGKKDYPNFQTLQKWIWQLECDVAKSIPTFAFYEASPESPHISQFERDMEWFLTWRVKLVYFPHLVWCDGVKIVEFENVDEQLFKFKANVWLGPESNVSTELLCKMEGTIKLNDKLNELESYQLQVQYQGENQYICKEA